MLNVFPCRSVRHKEIRWKGWKKKGKRGIESTYDNNCLMSVEALFDVRRNEPFLKKQQLISGLRKDISTQTTQNKLDMKHQRTTITTTKQQRPIYAEHKRLDSIFTTAFRVLDCFHDFMIVDVIDLYARSSRLTTNWSYNRVKRNQTNNTKCYLF